MEKELESAFRRTNYRVFADTTLLLRVDRAEPALRVLLHEADADSAALLTAFNPGGLRQPPFRNRQSGQRLGRELARAGFTAIAGRNEDPHGRWPVEPSLLVLALPWPRAHALAARYGQVAFLWIEADGTPRLIETAARAG
jgi:hypothetical protein